MGRFGGFDLVICQNPPTPTDLSRESSRSGAGEFDFTLKESKTKLFCYIVVKIIRFGPVVFRFQ